MIRISEKDLYIFVFYRDQLDSEKISYIKDNLSLFETEIAFLEDLKKNINKDVDESIIDRINKKIDKSANLNKSAVLEKVNPPKNNDHLILAADSPKTENGSKTETFIDKENHFLGKVISNAKMNKIYIFRNSNDNVFDVNITLFPSQNSYKVNSNNLPLIITPPQVIEQIKVDFS